MSDSTLRDWHLRDRERAGQEALRLAAARDDLTVRYRLGLATFNAASIVALLTAMGTASTALTKVGFSDKNVEGSLLLFCLGVIAAGISIASYQNELVQRAGFAAARVSIDDQLLSLASNPAHPGGNQAYERLQGERQELLEKELRYRPVGLWGQHLSAALWLGGALVPIMSLLGWK